MSNAFILRAFVVLCAFAIGAGSAASAATDRVNVGVSSRYPTYSLFYAAKELGYYQAADLDVRIQTFRSGPAAYDALAAGTIDVSPVVPAAVAAAQQKGAEERIVAMFAPSRPAGWFIMVPMASPIRTMAGLDGKTVGVTQLGSPTDVWVQKLATAAKIEVTSVALGGGTEAGLRAKRVDAAIVWPLGSYKGLLSGDLRALADLGANLPPTVTEGIAVTQGTIDKRSDVLKRWLIATAKALNFMKSHETWSEAFLKRYFNDAGADDKTIEMVYKNFIMKIGTDGVMRPAWERNALEPLGASAPKLDAVFVRTFTPVKYR